MRHLALAPALALVVAACTATSADTTTTTAPAADTTTTSSSPTTTIAGPDPLLGEPLPVDPDVRIGTLSNGLTYYIRHNDSPGGRLELRLMVDAGSVQEDVDQAGIAHFLEHMMFNGTERFPRNELIAVLESFGPRFGPDINAFTSFDETVYELSLGADDEELVQLGIDVLREWAGSATLSDADVVGERGVVLDEWRLRAQGFGGRISDAFQELVVPGTAYEGRLPIGDDVSIQATTPELLARFYEDWYRPDLMAIAAVGDIDVDEMEQLISEAFADLPAATSPRTTDPIVYIPPTEPRTDGLGDEEAAQASVTIMWPSSASSMATVGDLRSGVTVPMVLEMLANRLNDDALRGDAPLLGANSLGFSYTRAITLSGIDVAALPEDLDDALEAALVEIKRIREHGFTETEVERAFSGFDAASEQLHSQQGSIQDGQIVGQVVAHHLAGAHLMSPDQQFDVESRMRQTLDRDLLERVFREVTDTAPIILAVGPDDVPVPDSGRILELMSVVESTEVTAREDQTSDVLSLMPVPDPTEPVSSEVDDRFGHHTLVFENGATVFLWESDIAEDSVFFDAESFGGTSVIAVEDLPEAFVMTEIIGRSGIGPADVPTLERLLATRIAQVFPWVSQTREGLTGSSAIKDVEILFQMVHLYMTAPRFDDVAVRAVLAEIATVNESRGDLPNLLVDEAVDQAYYGDDPRYFAFPSAEQVADFDAAVAESIYRERFENAGDFAFAFVGDFDVTEMTELVSRYIGTLPGTGEREDYVDHQPLPPRRVQFEEVEAGADPQGLLYMFFTNPHEPDLTDRVTARLLDLILTTRLRDRIREEMSASYSVFAATDLQREPDPYAESFVNATGDPADLKRISDAVMEEIGDLQTSGPSTEEFATAVAQLRDELALIDNPTIADALITSFLYPDQPLSDLADQIRVLDEVTASDVRNLAAVAYNTGQRIEVHLVPRS